MQALQCDICGGSLAMDSTGEFATCESCGMKHDKRRMQQKVQEIKGTVKIDGTVRVEGVANVDNLLVRARDCFDKEEFQKAKEYCEKVLDIDANHRETSTLLYEINQMQELQLNCHKLLYELRNYSPWDDNMSRDGLKAYEYIVNHSQKPTVDELKFYDNLYFPNPDLKLIYRITLNCITFFVHKNDLARIKAILNKKFEIEWNYCDYGYKPQNLNYIFKFILSNSELFFLFKTNCQNINSALIYCVKDDIQEGVYLFLQLGADPNQYCKSEGKDISLIKCANNSQIKKLLKQYGAKTGLFG